MSGLLDFLSGGQGTTSRMVGRANEAAERASRGVGEAVRAFSNGALVMILMMSVLYLLVGVIFVLLSGKVNRSEVPLNPLVSRKDGGSMAFGIIFIIVAIVMMVVAVVLYMRLSSSVEVIEKEIRQFPSQVVSTFSGGLLE